MREINPPCVVTIAGTDPSGGAGIQADIKSISATGSYAASVITALVAQNTQGVQAIQAVPDSFVAQQIQSVFSDLNIKAVKIGMLHDARIINVVASALKKLSPPNVVIDPVMFAKDGSALLDLKTIALLKKELFTLGDLLTPNLPEAGYLLGSPLSTLTDMEQGAISLGKELNMNVLIKGGHLQSKSAVDVVYIRDSNKCEWFQTERYNTQHTHGTGCSLSSAIASFLAQGVSITEAIGFAKRYLTKAIRSGARYQIGKGKGPVDHFYFLRETHHGV
ncbi:bifunctional hydroxy-methylpyrimidine kinase and hydroxy-phosphomethylpyrimidine kinase (plasmid) [Legionella adelaidensis]|uniref:hydroxymethylpyrimidine kinase n=1 Tax=Legionella adelaidensis TaxID=45056 RepID=A0A0W0R142_9GAMM|nr:bifunctional hydroxymethylpyrimidine kinase/phosphomethylpyrimidine kinase [Legionella adelaidensis]KTC64718.1 bifunctional hydroxy-methylpyrimidine kinase and hydroxy-phosphomethylpyrimidine kinase [Legionella adelaidensis]VEH82849.1 bifunctional hydroxy-methylpyrimidine kinase and hydroxy-phosphomethylpyrimidine kinase [Legionella adelaidensis]